MAEPEEIERRLSRQEQRQAHSDASVENLDARMDKLEKTSSEGFAEVNKNLKAVAVGAQTPVTTLIGIGSLVLAVVVMAASLVVRETGHTKDLIEANRVVAAADSKRLTSGQEFDNSREESTIKEIAGIKSTQDRVVLDVQWIFKLMDLKPSGP